MLKRIIKEYPEEVFLKMDGHDNAVIGIDEKTLRLCYSMRKVIKNLKKDMNEEEALEYYYFNIEGAYVGKKTPILVCDYYF
jgi:hypothetical protein